MKLLEKIKPKKQRAVYVWFFIHGAAKQRIEDSIEGFINDVNKVDRIDHIKAMELYLAKDYINPKIINFVELRKEQVK